MNKKLTAFISLILVFSILAVPVFAKETMFGPREDWLITEDYIDDVYKYDFEKFESNEALEEINIPIEDMLFLGIMDYEESGLFEPDKIVTEKELAEIIIKLRYNGDSALLSYQKEFGSNENATLKKALTMIIDALGYSAEAKLYGEEGYIVIVNNLKLLKNVEYGNFQAGITKKQLAAIIYNAIEADPKMEVHDEYGNISFDIDKGNNFLWKNFNMIRIEGFFNGKDGINIYSSEKVKEDCIQIDRVNFEYNSEEMLSLFGRRVEGYAEYNENKKIYEIKLLREKETKYPAKTYNLKNGRVEETELVFEMEDETEEEMEISDLKYVLYNGDFVALNEINKYFDGRNALITFTSSEADKNYDIAIIKEFSSYPVKNVSTKDNRIVFDYNLSYDSKLYIELDPKKSVYMYDEELKTIDLYGLYGGEIVSIYQNKDKSYTEIAVSKKSFEGTVSAISDGEFNFSDGNKYIISPNYIQAIENKKALEIKLGTKGVFAVSFDGVIANCQIVTKNEWGIMRLCGTTGRGSEIRERKYQIRVYTSDGEWVDLELAEKLTFDGKSGVEVETVAATIASNSIEGTIIRYGTNSEGKVNFLDTVIQTADEVNDYNTVVKKWTLKNATANWTQGLSWKDCPGKITGSTIVFSVPEDLSKEKLYRITNNSVFVQDSKFNVDFYSPDNFLCCAAAVINEADGSQNLVYQGSHFLGVESVKQVIDTQTDDMKYVVKGWIWGRNHEQSEWELSDDFIDLNSQLPNAGGVYRYILSNGQIKYLDLLVDDGNIPADFAVNTGQSYERMTGTVVDIVDGYIKINMNGTEWVFTTNSGTYMSYSKRTKKFTKLLYSDIYIGERIYIYGAVENAGGMLVVRD